MTYKLMIKQHKDTKLMYLCITKKDDWQEYTGSGVYWIKHLKRHGYNFSTELLYEDDNYENFYEKCLFYSKELDVVKSKNFANLIPETGYINTDYSGNHWSKTENRDVICEKISKRNKKFWENTTKEYRKEYCRPFYEGGIKYRNNLTYEQRIEYSNKCSEFMKAYYNKVDKKIVSERNRKARLNISVESAQRRKEKIQEVYASGKHDLLYERFSIERKGAGNPAAKKILWFGEIFTKLEFEKKIKNDGLDYNDTMMFLRSEEDKTCKILYDETVKVYEKIMCPYCKKTTTKKPSSFKRWHFDNCKEKPIENTKEC